MNRIVREIGAASTVLLKNVNDTLPLKKPRRIVLIGISIFVLFLVHWISF